MTARRNLVLGLGKTGASVVRWLAARGENVTVNDSRMNPPGIEAISGLGNSVRQKFGGFSFDLLDDADQIVLSPGISNQEPIVQQAMARGIPVIGDIELFARHATAPVVAITGTNGKSTVTTLVAEMISAAGRQCLAGGNLGEPALNLLDQATPEFYVLELSSYQLEATENLQTAAAAVLNVSPDHMDRYADLNAYAAAKAKIYANSDVSILNADDPLVNSMEVPRGRRVTFSLGNSSSDFSLDNGWISRRGSRLLPITEIGIPGMHNVANALAAVAIGEALGISDDAMIHVLRSFKGLQHRMQVVAEREGVKFVDDSKGTNVGATVAAVAGLSESLVLVAGGDGKGQDFSPLTAAFAGKVRHAVLIGRDRELVAKAIQSVCTIEFADDMEQAVDAAARVATSGEIVLLSPACASLDMYRDYADRGNQFAAAARRLSA